MGQESGGKWTKRHPIGAANSIRYTLLGRTIQVDAHRGGEILNRKGAKPAKL